MQSAILRVQGHSATNTTTESIKQSPVKAIPMPSQIVHPKQKVAKSRSKIMPSATSSSKLEPDVLQAPDVEKKISQPSRPLTKDKPQLKNAEAARSNTKMSAQSESSNCESMADNASLSALSPNASQISRASSSKATKGVEDEAQSSTIPKQVSRKASKEESYPQSKGDQPRKPSEVVSGKLPRTTSRLESEVAAKNSDSKKAPWATSRSISKSPSKIDAVAPTHKEGSNSSLLQKSASRVESILKQADTARTHETVVPPNPAISASRDTFQAQEFLPAESNNVPEVNHPTGTSSNIDRVLIKTGEDVPLECVPEESEPPLGFVPIAWCYSPTKISRSVGPDEPFLYEVPLHSELIQSPGLDDVISKAMQAQKGAQIVDFDDEISMRSPVACPSEQQSPETPRPPPLTSERATTGVASVGVVSPEMMFSEAISPEAETSLPVTAQTEILLLGEVSPGPMSEEEIALDALSQEMMSVGVMTLGLMTPSGVSVGVASSGMMTPTAPTPRGQSPGTATPRAGPAGLPNEPVLETPSPEYLSPVAKITRVEKERSVPINEAQEVFVSVSPVISTPYETPYDASPEREEQPDEEGEEDIEKGASLSTVMLYPESQLVLIAGTMCVIWIFVVFLLTSPYRQALPYRESHTPPFATAFPIVKLEGNISNGNRRASSETYLCSTDFCSREGAYLSSLMREGVSPCDNFYEYVCKNWHRSSGDAPFGVGVASSTDTILEEEMSSQVLKYIMDTKHDDIIPARELYQACTHGTKERAVMALREIFKTWPISHWPLQSYPLDLGIQYVWSMAATLIREFGIAAIASVVVRIHQLKNEPVVEVGLPGLLFFSGDELHSEIYWMFRAAIRETAKEFDSTDLTSDATSEIMSVFTALAGCPTAMVFDAKLIKLENLGKTLQNFLSLVFQGTLLSNITVLVKNPEFILDDFQCLFKKVTVRSLLNYMGFRLIAGVAPFLPGRLENLRKLYSIDVVGRVLSPGLNWMLCLRAVEKVLPVCLVKAHARLRMTSGVHMTSRAWLSVLEDFFFRNTQNLAWVDAVTNLLVHQKLRRNQMARFFPPWSLRKSTCVNSTMELGNNPLRVYYEASKLHQQEILHRQLRGKSRDPGSAFGIRAR